MKPISITLGEIVRDCSMLPKSLIKAAPAAALAIFLVAACDRGGAGGDDTGADSPVSAAAGGAGDSPNGRTADIQVDAETLAYAEVDDELVYGYFAFPSDMIEPLPAVIAIHDWWGVNDDVRSAANRLAAEGYMVLAVDLYAGDVVSRPTDARERMISVVENPELVEDNIRQALDFVGLAGAPNVATLGWGFGGGWSLNSAMLFPKQIDAAVVLYGQVTNDEDKLRSLNAPVLGLFGEKDRLVTADSVRAFKTALQRIRHSHDVHLYPEIGHAFADPARSGYDQETTEDAWRRTAVFLTANLVSAGES